VKPALGTVLGSTVAVAVAVAALAASAPAASSGRTGRQHQASGLRIVSTIGLDSALDGPDRGVGIALGLLGREEIVRIDPRRTGSSPESSQAGSGSRPASERSGHSTSSPAMYSASTLGRIAVTRRIRVGGLPDRHRSSDTARCGSRTSSTRPSPGSRPRRARPSQGSNWISGGIWPGAILATSDAVWVVAGNGNVVNRIRPETSTVDLRIPIRGARSITIARGSVWVGVADSASLVRIANGKGHPRRRAGSPRKWVRPAAGRRDCPLAGRPRERRARRQLGPARAEPPLPRTATTSARSPSPATSGSPTRRRSASSGSRPPAASRDRRTTAR
jgi:hypothetical protein